MSNVTTRQTLSGKLPKSQLKGEDHYEKPKDPMNKRLQRIRNTFAELNKEADAGDQNYPSVKLSKFADNRKIVGRNFDADHEFENRVYKNRTDNIDWDDRIDNEENLDVRTDDYENWRAVPNNVMADVRSRGALTYTKQKSIEEIDNGSRVQTYNRQNYKKNNQQMSDKKQICYQSRVENQVIPKYVKSERYDNSNVMIHPKSKRSENQLLPKYGKSQEVAEEEIIYSYKKEKNHYKTDDERVTNQRNQGSNYSYRNSGDSNFKDNPKYRNHSDNENARNTFRGQMQNYDESVSNKQSSNKETYYRFEADTYKNEEDYYKRPSLNYSNARSCRSDLEGNPYRNENDYKNTSNAFRSEPEKYNEPRSVAQSHYRGAAGRVENEDSYKFSSSNYSYKCIRNSDFKAEPNYRNQNDDQNAKNTFSDQSTTYNEPESNARRSNKQIHYRAKADRHENREDSYKPRNSNYSNTHSRCSDLKGKSYPNENNYKNASNTFQKQEEKYNEPGSIAQRSKKQTNFRFDTDRYENEEDCYKATSPNYSNARSCRSDLEEKPYKNENDYKNTRDTFRSEPDKYNEPGSGSNARSCESDLKGKPYKNENDFKNFGNTFHSEPENYNKLGSGAQRSNKEDNYRCDAGRYKNKEDCYRTRSSNYSHTHNRYSGFKTEPKYRNQNDDHNASNMYHGQSEKYNEFGSGTQRLDKEVHYRGEAGKYKNEEDSYKPSSSKYSHDYNRNSNVKAEQPKYRNENDYQNARNTFRDQPGYKKHKNSGQFCEQNDKHY